MSPGPGTPSPVYPDLDVEVSCVGPGVSFVPGSKWHRRPPPSDSEPYPRASSCFRRKSNFRIFDVGLKDQIESVETLEPTQKIRRTIELKR